MSIVDWIVLIGTLSFIVGYGTWKTKGSKNIEGYLLGDKTMSWRTICLSIMATQASAITFLSTPGQAYEDGMGFIQFYFGLPVAMVLIAVTAVPIFARLNVFTAYEYLESRFDLKTRSLAAILFLIQRGLATGITIYAPAIILSTILHWNLNYTILIIGSLVIFYTVSGGTKAVSVTQNQQMAVMMGGMLVAGIMVVYLLPDYLSFGEAIQVAGEMDKFNLVNFSFNWNDRYNFWSGMTGGLFLAMSYFGTDQSQVARYLSGSSVAESRLGLLFNGLLKIPMQFLILFIGVMVFVFYQFHLPPLFFNKTEKDKINLSPYANEVKLLEEKHQTIFKEKEENIKTYLFALKSEDPKSIVLAKEKLEESQAKTKEVKKGLKNLLKLNDPDAETRDTDYVFITFVMEYLPHGIIGLLLAVFFCAAMSSTASALNALASTTLIDIYKRSVKKKESPAHYLNMSKLFTVGWGIVAILFSIVASLLENLIQAVNILGSLFYGSILGIFLVAFYLTYIKSNAVFIAAVIAESIVIVCYFTTEIGFLWYNVIGCVLVVIIAYPLQLYFNINKGVKI